MKQMQSGPAVSVLMSTRNGARYLRQALESMAAQTYQDWEWILIDDGSVDESPSILAEYANRFPDRVTILHNEVSAGLTASLNKGLAVARGTWVARMDDDDAAHPERLARQVSAMIMDPRLLLLGTSGYRFSESTSLIKPYMREMDPLCIRISLCWFNPFMHSSVMYRRVLPDGSPVGYNMNFPAAQDYELWTRLALLGGVRILPDRLMTYRDRPGNLTTSSRTLQRELSDQVRKRYSVEFTRGTELEGCLPDDIQQLMDDPGVPDRSRLSKILCLFERAMRMGNHTRTEKRRALMTWANDILERAPAKKLLSISSIRLFGRCGLGAFWYLAGRIFRKGLGKTPE